MSLLTKVFGALYLLFTVFCIAVTVGTIIKLSKTEEYEEIKERITDDLK